MVGLEAVLVHLVVSLAWQKSGHDRFNQFLGGGFDNGPGFVFNMGGGPGIRVHQFGGARPRRRPRDPNAPPEQAASLQSTLMGLLPLLFILILPILSSLFSGDGAAAGPSMRFDSAVPPHTMHRQTPRTKIDYYLNPVEVENYTPSQFSKLDQRATSSFISRLSVECQQEEAVRADMFQQAQGWFYQDADKMARAQKMEMRACKRLDSLGGNRNY